MLHCWDLTCKWIWRFRRAFGSFVRREIGKEAQLKKALEIEAKLPCFLKIWTWRLELRLVAAWSARVAR